MIRAAEGCSINTAELSRTMPRLVHEDIFDGMWAENGQALTRLSFVLGSQGLQLGQKECLESGCISTVHQLQRDLFEAG